ncbi:MAG TPA: hypothetical protein VES93_08280 [Ornithinibacter sp.]|nr:hypothetical protein [Ornithinibacter sp.]
MPPHEPALPGPGGYPPMTPLRGAVLGWPYDDALTSITSPGAARAALRAEAETSVADAVGLRRRWLGDLYGLLVMVLALVALVAFIRFAARGFLPPFPVWPMLLLAPLSAAMPWLLAVLTRAEPARGEVPGWPLARVRWHLDIRHAPATVPPPARWPSGSEAYAVLSAAAGAASVAPTWLRQRVGLLEVVGAQWVQALTRQGWLSGGGHLFGISRWPELHVQLTDAGRERLERERARLEDLARL